MRPAAIRLVFLVAALAVPGLAHGQQRECDITAPGRTERTANQVILLHDPFTVLCEDGAQLRANSGQLNDVTRELFLTGDVYFEDADRNLRSDEATYNRVQGRLWARGNVVFVNTVERSTLRGPELEYFRETEERPVAQVLATGRPTLTLEPDPEQEDGEPLNVVADRMLILGDDDLSAFDSVVITRSDLRATSAEARYNSTTEDLELRQDARIQNEEYLLTGEVIQAKLAEGSLEHVHSRTDARLEGDDMNVAAPDLQLFFAADTLRRAVAVAREPQAGVQAVARSKDFELQADSIDATFVDQQIREAHAIGAARAETKDTTTTELAEPADSLAVPQMPAHSVLASDWVRGDTVIGYFEPVVAGPVDSIAPAEQGGDPATPQTGEPEVELRKLVAIGSAQSLYRMAAEGEAEGGSRNVNFLVGQRIELDLLDGELSVASVKGLERGIYLEASSEQTAPVPPPEPDDSPEPALSPLPGVG